LHRHYWIQTAIRSSIVREDVLMSGDRLHDDEFTPHEAAALDATSTSGVGGAPSPILDDDHLPALFHAADHTSTSGQRQFFRATGLRLFFLVGAAAAAAGVKTDSQPISWLGFVGAILLITAAIVEVYIMRNRPEGRWYDGRAAAESAKTVAWRYAVGGAPFALDAMSQRDADKLLIQRLEDSLTDLDDLSFDPRRSAAQQITPRMRELRASPLEIRKAVYESKRIQDQIAWYADKNEKHERQARRLTFVVVAFEILGAIGALYFAIKPEELVGNAVGVAATAAAAVGVWLQAKQHQTLARAYAVAAQQLSSIRSMIRWPETEQDWSRFVDDAETAISKEHTLWRASRGLRRLPPNA
jgi:protein-S-isoprenylcysteine O-methyltransferase Ste14